MPTATTPTAPAAPGAGTAAFHAGTAFDHRSGRGTHSLLRRLPDGLTAREAAARFAAAQESGTLPTGLRLWTERLTTPAGHPSSEALRDREAGRTLAPGAPLRALLLDYADGAADLVLVAHRRSADSALLEALAGLLTDTSPAATGTIYSGLVAAPSAPRPVITEAVPPAWGLGDPTRAARTATVALGPVEIAPEPATAVLAAAAALALARYGEPGRTLGLLTADPLHGDRYTTLSLDPGEDTPVGELLGRAEEALAAPTAPGAEPPALGVIVLGGDRTGTAYRPHLEAPFPLTVTWRPLPDGTFTGLLEYNEAAAHPEVAARFAAHLTRTTALLGAKPAATELLAGRVEATSDEERAHLLALGRPHPLPAHEPATLHGAFARTAAATPGAAALSGPDGQLTYAALDAAADRIAAGLAERGIGPGSFVGVCLERDTTLVATLLGILKTGAAYVPMDPRYPAERLRYTTGDAGLGLVVTTLDVFPAADGLTILRPEALAASTAAAPAPAEDPDAPAYVIYTSGSTGRPKGVVVPHRNVTALVAATAPDLALGAGDVWTLFHSSAFDFSVWEIWGCLLTGGRLEVVPYWVSRSPEEFHALLADRGVTVLSQTPSAFAALRRVHLDGTRPLSLRLVVFGGEPLDTRSLELWFRREPHDRTRLVNMFGITETTVHVTARTVTPVDVAAGSRSVGTALPGWTLSVRDAHGRVQPLGVPGEIHVGGAGLADRYLGRPELTAERFVTDPVTGERVYRSGDLGRLRPDGGLDHLGRIDDQVKVRGFRIELGEIRSVLLDDPRVTDATVVLHRGDGDAADTRLDAYVVLRPGGTVPEVRGRLRGLLPEHMLPGTLTAVPEIPLTVNGKADTARLPRPDTLPAAGGTPTPAATTATERDTAAAVVQVTTTPAATEPPSGEQSAATGSAPGASVPAEPDPVQALTEQVLRAWRATLGPDTGPDDDFFELGGNSLMAVRLSAALRREGLPPVPLRDLYLQPTAALLVKHLTDRQTATPGSERP